jgi:DNA-damage-inducible protein D
VSKDGPKTGREAHDPQPGKMPKEEPRIEPGLASDDISLDLAIVTSPDDLGGKQVRKIFHQDEWWFSIVDVIGMLVGNDRPSKYWNDLKNRLFEEGYDQLSAKIGKFKMPSYDGKFRHTECATTETMLRIIQSIPSPRVEPLKQWLARIGKERFDEIENPEISIERMQEIYEKKGYPKEWIGKRIEGMIIRQKLTDEWKSRGVESDLGFAILTNEIMQGAFDLKVEEYKQVKGLKRENLRDHMTDLELILTMLGEATTTQLHKDRDSQKLAPLQRDAKEGGAVAGRARADIEKQLGKSIISKENFKDIGNKQPRMINLEEDE